MDEKCVIQDPVLEQSDEGSEHVPMSEINSKELEALDKSAPAKSSHLLYGVNESPPFQITVFYAIQMIVSYVDGSISAVYLIHASICAEGNDVLFAELVGTAIFMCGVCTLLQVTFGSRLPIFQGSSKTFILPIIAMVSTPEWRCQFSESAQLGDLNGTMLNGTNKTFIGNDEQWRSRISEISGGLIVASLVQVALGMTGVLGIMMSYIGPLTIVPTISLIGLALFDAANSAARHNWPLTFLTIALIIMFALVLGNIQVPCPVWNRQKGCHLVRYPIFKLFPQIISIAIVWTLCVVLTYAGAFTSDPQELGYNARSDAKSELLYQTKWFYLPYPGHRGRPTFSGGIITGMLAATFSSIIESVGDYYATARVCGLPPPPKHAVNRGVAMEGFGSVLCGLVGAAHATTSYSKTIGFIGVTGVGSRVVMQVTGILLIILGVCGKAGAICAMIPDPIIGGLTTVGLGVVIGVALSTLSYIDLQSSRNHMILGVSFMLGMMLPMYTRTDPHFIQTGSKLVDQILTVFASTNMFVGGATGFILDNLVPGTDEERGITKMGSYSSSCEDGIPTNALTVYDLPQLLNSFFRKYNLFSYIPCLPSFKPRNMCTKRAKTSQ